MDETKLSRYRNGEIGPEVMTEDELEHLTYDPIRERLAKPAGGTCSSEEVHRMLIAEFPFLDEA